jgi:3',5'-cyclic AMP phosphodiesterase CpdA
MKLIHLTDTHIVEDPAHLFGLDPRVRLDAAVADINDNHADAAFVVVTGDLTNRAEPEAYRTLKLVLDGLAVPYHLLVGNHDRRAPFRAAFPACPVDANGFIQYEIVTDAGVVLCLDTLDEASHAGELCADRLAWLADRLAARADRPIFVFLHHPPCPLGLASLDAISLMGQGLGEILAAHNDVRHLFFGHVHRPIHGTWRGIPYTCQRSTVHQTALKLADDKIVACLEQPAYGVILIRDDAVAVHTHSFLDTSPTFKLSNRAAETATSVEELRLVSEAAAV